MIRILLSALVLAVTASIAQAHLKLHGTTPANESTVGSVEVITLEFEAPIRVTSVSLSGPDGTPALERQTGLDPVTEFRAAPTAALPAGHYAVEWRGLAEDGHPMQGGFVFTVAN
jgi:copper resistance protein C